MNLKTKMFCNYGASEDCPVFNKIMSQRFLKTLEVSCLGASIGRTRSDDKLEPIRDASETQNHLHKFMHDN